MIRNYAARLLAILALLLIFPSGHSPAESLEQWDRRNVSAAGTPLRVSFGNGLFVAVGGGGVLYTSKDGSLWTARASGAGPSLSDVAFGAGKFVAVGAEGTVLNSRDGLSWEAVDSGMSSNLNGVAFGDQTFVAVGENGEIFASSNGVSWIRENSGTTRNLRDVAFAQGRFVAVGEQGTIVGSRGGGWTIQNSGTGLDLNGIAYGNQIFVAVGQTILTSPDGTAWTEAGPRTNDRLFGVAYGGGLFTAVAEKGGILTSSDGAQWTRRNSGIHSNIVSVAFGEKNFVAAAEEGILLLSESVSSPRISASPASMDFGSVEVEHSSSQTLTVGNSGSAVLNIQKLSIGGSDAIDFTIQNDACTGTAVQPAQNCTVQIVFSPHSGGSRSAALSISSNDPASPTLSVPLNGSSPGSEGTHCFVSFLAGGPGWEGTLDLFRKFRDIFLMKSSVGRAVVDFYYKKSPAWIDLCSRHELLKSAGRMALTPVAAFSFVMMKILGWK